MDIKILKKYKLVKGTGVNKMIGVPYKTDKGYKTRWVEEPNSGQWEFIKNYVETQPVPKPKKTNK